MPLDPTTSVKSCTPRRPRRVPGVNYVRGEKGTTQPPAPFLETFGASKGRRCTKPPGEGECLLALLSVGLRVI